MTTTQPNQQPDHTQLVGFVVLVVLGSLGIYAFRANTKDPLGGKTAEIVRYLSQEKTLCENAVRDLHRAGLDGRTEYAKVQVAANGCIGYLQGVLDQGAGNEEAIRNELASLATASAVFRSWALQQLQVFGEAKKELDLTKLVSAVLRLLDTQEKERRKMVKETLEGCKFRSRDEIVAGR